MKRLFTSEEWQRIINEYVKAGCCANITFRVLRSGRFPPFECLSRKALHDYLRTREGDNHLRCRQAAHEEQIQADLKAMAEREERTLHEMNLYELWEELTKVQMRRGILGDQESTRLAIQLLHVGPRVHKPPQESPSGDEFQRKWREQWRRNHKDDYIPPLVVPPLPPLKAPPAAVGQASCLSTPSSPAVPLTPPPIQNPKSEIQNPVAPPPIQDPQPEIHNPAIYPSRLVPPAVQRPTPPPQPQAPTPVPIVSPANPSAGNAPGQSKIQNPKSKIQQPPVWRYPKRGPCAH